MQSLTLEQAARRMGVDRERVVALLDAGQLSGERTGARWTVVDADSVRRWLGERDATSDVRLVPDESGIALDPGDASEITLDDDDLLLGLDDTDRGESGISLEPGDSGIALVPTDSGLSLEEEPVELGTSSVTALELPEDDFDGIGLDSDTAMLGGSDEEFILFDEGDDDEFDEGDDEADPFGDEPTPSSSHGGERTMLGDSNVFDDDPDADLAPVPAVPLPQPITVRPPRTALGLLGTLLFGVCFVALLAAVGAGAWWWARVYQPQRQQWDSDIRAAENRQLELEELLLAQGRALASLRLRTKADIEATLEAMRASNDAQDAVIERLDERTSEHSTDLVTIRTDVRRNEASARDTATRLREHTDSVAEEFTAVRNELSNDSTRTRDRIDTMRIEAERAARAAESAAEFVRTGHERILESASKLDALNRARLKDALFPTSTVAPPEDHPRRFDPEVARRRVESALDEPATLELVETPLGEAVRYLEDDHAVTIRIDQRSLDDAGVPDDQPVNQEISDIPLRDALDSILRPLELGWTVRNGTIVVLSESDADGLLFTRAHDVGDLLARHGRPFGDDRDLTHSPDGLVRLVENTVNVGHWQDGGNGETVKAVNYADGTLVVSQNQRHHHEIRLLLDQLRSARERRSTETTGLVEITYPVGRPRNPDPGGLGGPNPNLNPLSSYLGGGAAAAGTVRPDDHDVDMTPATEGETDVAEKLAEVLPTILADANWDEENGGGLVRAVPGALVVRQAPTVQVRIRHLLLPFMPARARRLHGEGDVSHTQNGPGAGMFGGNGFGSY